ncbi:MAG: LysM peptidoglycan-binding domain-containing protein [Gemmatimonadota bacterium]
MTSSAAVQKAKRRPAVYLGLSALVSAACAGHQSPPETAVAPLPIPDSALLAPVEPQEVDPERLAEVQREVERAVEELDEATRREFLLLFGPDPLGLAARPDNAARFEIPLEINTQVERWIDYFRNTIPERFATYLARAGRYEGMILEKLRAAGLPEDLLYLPLIESGMNPNAYSRAHAVGMWQFIRGTGRRYGLEITYWVDERRDPYRATDAAIAHLSDLYGELGSWYLAAAAYNGGIARVRRGIRRTGSHSFWDLSDARVLRRETRQYVPKLIAAALIGRDPAAYGFGWIEKEEPIEFDEVEVPDATSFDVLAEAAGTSEDTIKLLNPRYLRRVTPPDRRVMVRVPRGRGGMFAVNYAKIPPSERVTWLVHTVTRGQTLSQIARRYGTTVTAIRAANNNVRPRRLQIGQKLVVPRSGKPSSSLLARSSRRAPRPPEGPTTVTVRRGDTLWAIARRYNVTTRQLMAWNGLTSSLIRPGDRLTVGR